MTREHYNCQSRLFYIKTMMTPAMEKHKILRFPSNKQSNDRHILTSVYTHHCLRDTRNCISTLDNTHIIACNIKY